MTREEAMGIIYLDLMCAAGKLATLTDDDFEEANSLKRKIEALDMAHNALKKALQERPKGRWIELPCEIGDTVYLVLKYLGNPLGIIREDKVQMIGVTSRGIHLKLRNHHDHNKMYMLGKTVFLTKEEAEKALADMKGE